MTGTPAQNGNSAAGNNDFSRRAEELAQEMWMTPVANDDNKTPEAHMAMKARMKGGPRNTVTSLQVRSKMWTTPQAHDVTARGSGQVPTSKAGNACLATDAMQWGTPRASDAEKGGPNQAFGAGGIPLPAQAAQWPTPQSRDLRMGDNPDSPRQQRKMDQGWSQNLNDLAETWPTPAAQNVKGSSEGSITRADGKSRMDILHYRAEQGFSLPAHLPPAPGPTLSQLRPIWRQLRASLIASHGRAVWRRLWASREKARLNPIFVSWLMGWPPGHANCACSATEWSRWQQDMRGALSQLPTASGAWIWKPPAERTEPMQHDLFAGVGE